MITQWAENDVKINKNPTVCPVILTWLTYMDFSSGLPAVYLSDIIQ